MHARMHPQHTWLCRSAEDLPKGSSAHLAGELGLLRLFIKRDLLPMVAHKQIVCALQAEKRNCLYRLALQTLNGHNAVPTEVRHRAFKNRTEHLRAAVAWSSSICKFTEQAAAAGFQTVLLDRPRQMRSPPHLNGQIDCSIVK